MDIKPSKVDVRFLRAGGATALMCANIDTDTLGHWCSDTMVWYLHLSAHPAVRTYV